LTVLTIGTLYQSSKTVKTIGVPIVTGLPRLYQQCTNRQKRSITDVDFINFLKYA